MWMWMAVCLCVSPALDYVWMDWGDWIKRMICEINTHTHETRILNHPVTFACSKIYLCETWINMPHQSVPCLSNDCFCFFCLLDTCTTAIWWHPDHGQNCRIEFLRVSISVIIHPSIVELWGFHFLIFKWLYILQPCLFEWSCTLELLIYTEGWNVFGHICSQWISNN